VTEDQVRELHGIAMALVVMHHADDATGIVEFVSKLSLMDTGGVLAILTSWVDEAWAALADIDGSTFEEFTATAGLWLARGGQ
jgi:hypothetical protein